MAIRLGRYFGQVQMPTRTLVQTPPAPRDQLIVATVLPGAEPGVPQLTFTILDSDYYQFSGCPVEFDLSCRVLLCGSNMSGGNREFNLRAWKNGVQGVTASTTSTNNYYFWASGTFRPCVVGDVLGISVWSNGVYAGLTYNYCVLLQYVTRWAPFKRGTLYAYCYEGSSTPNNNWINYAWKIPNVDTSASREYFRQFHDILATSAPALPSTTYGIGGSPTYGSYRVQVGDINTDNAWGFSQNATYRMAYIPYNSLPVTVRGVALNARNI